MIDFRNVWLPQIIGYAVLIADDKALRSVWISGDQSFTSVTSFDELIEQMFDDLDSEVMWNQHKRELADHISLQASIDAFLHAILAIDEQYGSKSCTDHAALLSSSRWLQVRETAEMVVKCADKAKLTYF